MDPKHSIPRNHGINVFRRSAEKLVAAAKVWEEEGEGHMAFRCIARADDLYAEANEAEKLGFGCSCDKCVERRKHYEEERQKWAEACKMGS